MGHLYFKIKEYDIDWIFRKNNEESRKFDRINRIFRIRSQQLETADCTDQFLTAIRVLFSGIVYNLGIFWRGKIKL